MKKTLIILLTGFVGFLSSQQAYRYQPLTVVTVHNPMTPLPILNHFARNYPGVIPYWGFEGNNYVARYLDPESGLRRALVYNRHGVILRVENEVRLEDCPSGMQEYYHKNYKHKDIRAWSYEDDSNFRYFLRNGSRTVWFDRNGKHIRKRFLVL